MIVPLLLLGWRRAPPPLSGRSCTSAPMAKLEAQLHELHAGYPQCTVSQDQYVATLRYALPGPSFLTLELQLQPEFKAKVRELRLASGHVLQPEQLRHSWLRERGEIDQRAYEQKLGARVTWRRSDDLCRVVKAILEEFVRVPPGTGVAGLPAPGLAASQAPPPTYNQAAPPTYSQAAPPTYSQALPAYTALQPQQPPPQQQHQPPLPQQQPPPAVRPLAVPTMPPASLATAAPAPVPPMTSSAMPPSVMHGVGSTGPTPGLVGPAEPSLAPVQLSQPPPGLGARPSLGSGGGGGNGALQEAHRPSISPPIAAVTLEPSPSSSPGSVPVIDVIPSSASVGTSSNSRDGSSPAAVVLPPPTLVSPNAAAAAAAGPGASTSPRVRAAMGGTSSAAEHDAALQEIKAENVVAAEANLGRREELAAALRDVQALRDRMASVEQERQRLLADYERVVAS